MPPIRIAMCGRSPQLLGYVIKGVQPEIEAIHACTTPDAALRELPALLRGEKVIPSSGLGSNAEPGHFTPGTEIQAISLGGAFSDTHCDAIRKVCDPIRSITWLRHDNNDLRGFEKGFPEPRVVQERLRRGLFDNMKDGKLEPGKVYFY